MGLVEAASDRTDPLDRRLPTSHHVVTIAVSRRSRFRWLRRCCRESRDRLPVAGRSTGACPRQNARCRIDLSAPRRDHATGRLGTWISPVIRRSAVQLGCSNGSETRSPIPASVSPREDAMKSDCGVRPTARFRAVGWGEAASDPGRPPLMPISTVRPISAASDPTTPATSIRRPGGYRSHR